LSILINLGDITPLCFKSNLFIYSMLLIWSN